MILSFISQAEWDLLYLKTLSVYDLKISGNQSRDSPGGWVASGCTCTLPPPPGVSICQPGAGVRAGVGGWAGSGAGEGDRDLCIKRLSLLPYM